jgi:regulator of sirC expression with transglutaminase-like and TPR domain
MTPHMTPDTISPLDYFASLVQDDDGILLFEAALVIAQGTAPHFDLAATQAQMDILASRLMRRLPPDVSTVQKLRMLNHFFYRELGFGANLNDFYDPDNSYLHRVLDTRRGIPISLAVLYMELAQQIGLRVAGIAFPGHFLMKLSVRSGDIVIDPLDGSSLSRETLEQRLAMAQPEHLADVPLSAYLQTATPREILVRMLRNLKIIFAQNESWQHMLEVQQRLLVLMPHDVAERRDRGLTYAKLSCPVAAIEDLEAYLTHKPHAVDASTLRARLPELREAARRLN